MLWLLLLVSSVACNDFRFVCYYTNTALHRPGNGRFTPEDISPHQCTHIIYAYATPDGLGIAATDEDDKPTPQNEGTYKRVIRLKEKNPNLKVLLALAGPNTYENPFIPVLSTSISRSAAAQNAIVYLRQYNFDGLDVSWKYPDLRGKPILNREKFVLFLKELQATFKLDAVMRRQARLLLSVSLPGAVDEMESGYDSLEIIGQADFVSLMAVSYYNERRSIVTLSTPFHTIGGGHQSLEFTIDYLHKARFPLEKINIGLGLHGLTFSLTAINKTSIGSMAAGPGKPGPFTKTPGFLAYYECIKCQTYLGPQGYRLVCSYIPEIGKAKGQVCQLIKAGARVYDVPTQHTKYLVKDNLWVSYEHVRGAILKACFVYEHFLGGVTIRSLDVDDFNGQFCGQGTYPLITAIRSVIHDSSCKVYTMHETASGGHRQIMKQTIGCMFLTMGLSLLR